MPAHTFDADDNLVFYFENESAFAAYTHQLEQKNIPTIPNKNDYWNRYGRTYADPDGHQVILSYKQIYPLDDYLLKSKDTTTQTLIQKGITTWGELVRFVQHLPYGRNTNRSDCSLVLSEGKGTCSSKHALLMHIAQAHHFLQVQLQIGIYKMKASNTKGVGKVLRQYQLDHLPEAHCYLKINEQRYDYTRPESDISLIEKDLLLERNISVEDVAEFKVILHKGYLMHWIEAQNLPYAFEEIWAIREACIRALEE